MMDNNSYHANIGMNRRQYKKRRKETAMRSSFASKRSGLCFFRAVLCVAAGVFLCAAGRGTEAVADFKKSGLHSYFKIQIVMEKKEYQLGEPLEGQVVIKTTAPALLSGGFEVRLFQGTVLRSAKKVFSNNLSLGDTIFEFRKFGIPELFEDEKSLGTWRLLIFQVHQRYNEAEASFKVVPREDK